MVLAIDFLQQPVSKYHAFQNFWLKFFVIGTPPHHHAYHGYANNDEVAVQEEGYRRLRQHPWCTAHLCFRTYAAE